jgi:hypothetical protein
MDLDPAAAERHATRTAARLRIAGAMESEAAALLVLN